MSFLQHAKSGAGKAVALRGGQPAPANVFGRSPAYFVTDAVIQRAQADTRGLTPGHVLTLQRMIGNRAVGRLLARGRSASHANASARVVQAKLTVGPANDIYEREADRIARSIAQTGAAAPSATQLKRKEGGEESLARVPVQPVSTIRRIQRVTPVGAEGGALDADVERRLRRSQGGGRPMPDAVRRAIEPKLGVDLTSVKVHTGREAVQLNRDLGAKAFTHGNHIFYGAGQSPHDLELTAHEAVHTVQQGATSPGTLQRKKKKNTPPVDPQSVEKTVPKDANKFKLTLAVWQDDPNFLRESAKFVVKKFFMSIFSKKKPTPPSSTGHSWVELRAFKGDNLVFSDSYGFTPGGVSHPDSFHGDSGEDVLYRDYEISKDKFLNVIATAESIVKEDPKYDLKGMNCTKFARALVLAAGLKFMGNRVVPGAKFGPGKAFTPNRLFSAMSSRHKKGKKDTYKLQSPRKDLSLQAAAPRRLPVMLYVTPDEESPHKYAHTDVSQIVKHRPYDMDPLWSEVVVKGDEEEGELTYFALTSELKAFLTQGDSATTNVASTIPFDPAAVRAYVESEEWDMLEQQVGPTPQQFKNLTLEQVTYLAQLWEMSVATLQNIIARAPA